MLSHVDKNGLPTMVDVTDKIVTSRSAVAQSRVLLPPEMKPHLVGDEIYLKKGPVFQTAVIAGTMAVKKTHEIIPFCHQIPVEGCKFQIEMDDTLCVTIRCEVRTTSKTGVEMEALHGSSVAALTVYDMCKAVSHHIVIQETRLLSKVGGKSTFLAQPLYGLVLTGGKSARMKRDKALIPYTSEPHALFLREVLKKYCAEVYLSARKGQWSGTALEGLPTIEDVVEHQGPIGGIVSAFEKHSHANWFVVACDLPYFNDEAAKKLLLNFDEESVATCFRNVTEGFPEALCGIYSPAAKAVFAEALAAGDRCPVKVLKRSACKLLNQDGAINLANINTPEEYAQVQSENG